MNKKSFYMGKGQEIFSGDNDKYMRKSVIGNSFQVLIYCLMLACTGVRAEGGNCYTIMPLGDSITEGKPGFFWCYREPLLEKLLEAGYPVKFVGSKGKEPLLHEGYSGQNIGWLADKFEKLYRQNPADIVLVHAGHNYSAEENPVAGMILHLGRIIATARNINPRVIFLVAQVIPSGKLPKYGYIPAYNMAVAKLVKALDTPEQRVILVDQADGFNWSTDTIADKVHPSQQGAEKMAERWFEALQKILVKDRPAHSS